MASTDQLNKHSASKLDAVANKKVNASCDYRIVHVGIGAFHRAHQAVFTDIANEKSDRQWAITGISMRSAGVRDALAKQDYLYSVLEKSVSEEKLRVVSSVEDVIVAKEDLEKAVNAIVDPKTKIVSVTVTEKGYCHINGKLDKANPAVVNDLKALECQSLPGFLTRALAQRAAKNGEKITLMSCDNLPHNGAILKNVVLEFAEQVDQELVTWINNSVAFCSTMVDRIVPASTEDSVAYISEKLGLQDDAALLCEPFKQWVIEDNFNVERPDWASAGALFTKDVEAYEKLKLRFLNGCHSFVAYSGLLLGDEYIHDTVVRPDIARFIKGLSLDEMAKSLSIPAGISAVDYQLIIAERFANSFVPYKNSQVATDGSLKVPQRFFMPALDLISAKVKPDYLCFAMALWIFYLSKVYSENVLYFSDPLESRFDASVFNDNNSAETTVGKILEMIELNAADADVQAELISTIGRHYDQLRAVGFAAALAQFLG